MANLTDLTDAIVALPPAIDAAGAAVSARLDTLNAEIASLTAALVPQATIDSLTAEVNTAIAAIEAITALATA